jgi:hypothetical protein
MLGKLPLVSTSFANLTTDESLEAVPIATDYEKLIPIHYFYFPIIRQVLRIRARKFRATERQRKLRWQDLHPQSYVDASDINHGFVRAKHGAITTFDVPAAGTGPFRGTIPLSNRVINVFSNELISVSRK